MGSPSSSMMTPEMQQKIQTLLNDPVAGPKLMAIINSPNTGVTPMGSVASTVGKQKTLGGQMGAGIGGAAALGIKSLLSKNANQSQANTALKNQSGELGDFMSSQGNFGGGEDIGEADTEMDRRGGVIGRKRKFASGGEAPPEAPKKRGLLVRRPILSTTIVIAKKPKAKAKVEKKASGGAIKTKPSKPKAVPPRHGPGNGNTEWPPTPFRKGGHVQSPRGAGIARRGKSFRGIF